MSRISAADFYANHRGGGLVSENFHQRAGSWCAFAAYRLGVPTAALTLGNAVIGVATSVAVVLLAGRVVDGEAPAWLAGAVATVGWHLAYTLDCADGQLARTSGHATPAGGRLDVCCDLVVHSSLVAALGSVAVAQRPGTPAWLIAVFATTWMVSILGAPGAYRSLLPSRSLKVRVVKLLHDYGALLIAVSLVLLTRPSAAVYLIAFVTTVNGTFVLVHVAQEAVANIQERAPVRR